MLTKRRSTKTVSIPSINLNSLCCIVAVLPSPDETASDRVLRYLDTVLAWFVSASAVYGEIQSCLSNKELKVCKFSYTSLEPHSYTKEWLQGQFPDFTLTTAGVKELNTRIGNATIHAEAALMVWALSEFKVGNCNFMVTVALLLWPG